MAQPSTIPDLSTRRLRLVHATKVHLNAELLGFEYLGRELNAEIASDWPPEHYDSNVINYVINYLEQNPEHMKWSLRYIVKRDSEIPTLIGGCGFKGQPDSSGMVEIGYGLTSMFQKQGYATEAAIAMIDHAFSDPRVQGVFAHTLPDHVASIGVMLRAGMEYESEAKDDGVDVVRYGIRRETFEESTSLPSSK